MSWTLITTTTPFRSVTRVVQPVVEAVSLGRLKDHLRIDQEVADDDEYLRGLIAAARIVVEERLGRTLMLTRWRAKLGEWSTCSCRGIEVPYAPLVFDSIQYPVEIRYKDRDGADQAVNADNIEVDAEEIPGRIKVRETIANECCERNATIYWWAGCLAQSEVPSPLRMAVLRLAGQMYTNRGDSAESLLAADPGLDALLSACSINGRF